MKQYTCDIAVVAAGPSGLAAAVTAAENSMDVVVLEKASVTGGAANMGMGPFGVESRIQKENMIAIRKEDVFREMMEYTHWQTDARKLREYIWKSGSTIDWLEDMGVEFAGPCKYFPSAYPTWHAVKPENGGRPGPRCAGAMNKVMTNRAVELGVRLLLNTKAVSLLTENGKIAGVRAQDVQSGEEVEVRSKAVIVATGGFGDNPDMINQYAGCIYGEDMFNIRIPGVTGDGMRMVWEAGGRKGKITMEKIIWSRIPHNSMETSFRQPCALMVNKLGERVMDESVVENASVSANIISRQPGSRLYSVIDSRLVNYYKKKGVDYPSGIGIGNDMSNFEEDFAQLLAEYPDCVWEADSPEELAAKIGMDADSFCETMEEYNLCCEEHVDDIFCKNHHYLRPLTGKLYAMEFCPGAYGSLGGIQVNYKFQVQGEDYRPIPGLYASGTDTCDIYADTYLFVFPGNTMGYAINSGRLAAEHAVEYVEELGEIK